MPALIKTKNVYAIALLIFFTIACNAQTTIKTGGDLNSSVDYKKIANIDTLVNGYISRDWVKGG